MSVRTIQVVHSVTTDIDSEALAPGEPVYLRIAAVNDVGVGSFATPEIDAKLSELDALAPSAPPGLTQNVRVFAEREDATTLLVTWESVDADNGAEVTGWRIEYANASYSEARDNDWKGKTLYAEAGADARSFLLDNLTVGTTYAVGVRAVNARGPSPPAWYAYSRPTLPWWYEQTDMFDVKEGRQRATATCPPTGVTECEEDADYFILARAVPAVPDVSPGARKGCDLGRLQRVLSRSLSTPFG